MRLGDKIDEEELHAVKHMNADQSEGAEIIPVLFEEMDGVWLHIQDEQHKRMKKQEMKVFLLCMKDGILLKRKKKEVLLL